MLENNRRVDDNRRVEDMKYNDNGGSSWSKEAMLLYINERFATLKEQTRERAEYIKENLEVKLKAAESAIQTSMDAADKALTKAEISMEKRYEILNELRAVVDSIIATLLTRAEFDAQHKTLIIKHDSDIEALTDKMEASIKSVMDKVIYNTGRIDKIEIITDTVKSTKGEAKADTKNVWAYIISGVAFLSSVSGLIVLLTQCADRGLM